MTRKEMYDVFSNAEKFGLCIVDWMFNEMLEAADNYQKLDNLYTVMIYKADKCEDEEISTYYLHKFLRLQTYLKDYKRFANIQQ